MEICYKLVSIFVFIILNVNVVGFFLMGNKYLFVWSIVVRYELYFWIEI